MPEVGAGNEAGFGARKAMGNFYPTFKLRGRGVGTRDSPDKAK